jgi:rhomboid protease GluP
MGSYSPTPGPEILPPGAGMLPPQPVRKPRPGWAAAPATYLLVGINCAVFVAMVANRVSITSPTTGQLMHWGANNAGSVLINDQWWRIITAMFVHVGILHLATNMWCLWNLGLLAEPLMGSAGVMAVYILTGAAGNLLSTFAGWAKFGSDWATYHASGGTDMAVVFPPGAGASGAVFGIAGALIILLKSNRLPVPPLELKKLRRSVIYFAALNLVLGFSINVGTRVLGYGLSIDNMAHLGGFICGLLFAAPMVPRLGSPRKVFQTRLRVAVGLVVGVLVLFGVFLTRFAG